MLANCMYLCTNHLMKAFLLRLFHNKYFYTILVFVVWMVFFDQNKLHNQQRLHESLTRLEQQKLFFNREIEQNKKFSEAMSTDTALLEKFAREKYLMKRDNEDIYLVVKEKQNKP